MCSINGYVDFKESLPMPVAEIRAAGEAMRARGPDGKGEFFDAFVGFYHNRLAVMDPAGGAQPFAVTHGGQRFVMVYNGEIYNEPELRRTLREEGAVFTTSCDTETVLWCYILHGESAPELLNGIFAFAVYDVAARRVFAARDRLGVKPFFYALRESRFYFASEEKGLLCHREIPPVLTREGLWRLLYLSPVTLPGHGVFRDVRELPPGFACVADDAGFRQYPYWQLRAAPCNDTPAEAAAHVRELVFDAVNRQTRSDVPLAVLLSGGLDSSAVSAVAAAGARARGERAATYSFCYAENEKYFKASLFQPEGDDRFAAALAKRLDTDHTVLTVPTAAVAENLLPAAVARDLPGQADIDSSLLWFCREIRRRHTVILSGECADEIFGGYPWFYRPEMLRSEFFPWMHDPTVRASLFREEVVHPREGLDWLRQVCRESRENCPGLPEDSESMRVAREATCLSVRYFMANLLCRKDRMSMAAGLEVRVPFADHRILEYVYNVPWEIRFEGQVEKALLRHAMEGMLPPEILWRKKSPYPKTFDPAYERAVRELLAARLARGGFLAETLERGKLQALCEGESGTWFGQLMARPQLLAWLCQLDGFAERCSLRLAD